MQAHVSRFARFQLARSCMQVSGVVHIHTLSYATKTTTATAATTTTTPAMVVQTVLVGVPQLQSSRQSSTFLVWRKGRWGAHCLKTVRFQSCSLLPVRGVFLEPSMMKSFLIIEGCGGGLITQLMSPISLSDCLHRLVVVDMHALVVHTLPKQQ